MTLLQLLENKGFGPYRKSGSRYTGPCPFCGGSGHTTRFVTKEGSDTGKCFSCGRGVTSVRLLMEMEGLKCKDAHATLGRSCDNTACPVWDNCQGTPARRRSSSETVTVPRERRRDSFIPSPATTPPELWRQKAEALIQWAHQQLLTNPGQLAYLASRGLDRVAVERYRLGWIPENLYRERTAWGLPVELNEKGQPKKLWIPRGHTIPSVNLQSTINRVRIRRTNADLDADRQRNPDREPLRYYAIPGSGNDIAVIGNPAAKAVVVVESDLDALLLHHLAGDFCAVIPLTTVTATPKEAAAVTLAGAAVILVALDADLAGTARWPWWHEHYPQAEQLIVPAGKDPGEAFSRGVDLRKWVLDALPISCHPARVAKPKNIQSPAPVADIVCAHKRITTATGRSVYETTDRATYADLVAQGAAVFTPRELAMVGSIGLSHQQAEIFVDVKEIFPGCWVSRCVSQ